MTTLLVFTRNFAMRQAIQGLSSADRAVFFFDNRLEFIVCATILDKPCILIDAIDETTDNIGWLYSRLAARGLSRRTYFISPEENTGNSYLKLFWLVTTIKELKALCDRAAKLPTTEKIVGNSRCYLRQVIGKAIGRTSGLSDDAVRCVDR